MLHNSFLYSFGVRSTSDAGLSFIHISFLVLIFIGAFLSFVVAPGPAPDVRCFNTVLAAIASAAAKDGRRGSNEDRSDVAEEALNQSYESDVW